MSGEEMRERQLATIKGHAEVQRLIRDNEEVAQLDPGRPSRFIRPSTTL